jgi:uncharacterized protein (TIGR02145 family)
VNINGVTWLAQNFAYNYTGSSSVANNSANDMTLGRFYQYNICTATNFAPPGWHLATQSDWFNLVNYLGGTGVAGGMIVYR